MNKLFHTLISPGYLSGVDPSSWDRLTWEILIHAVERPDLIGMYVTDVRCGACGRVLSGALFIDRESGAVSDTWNFMLFDTGVKCDRCLGDNSWIPFALALLRATSEPFRYFGDPSMNLEKPLPSGWRELLLGELSDHVVAFIAPGVACDCCGNRLVGALSLDLKSLQVSKTLGFTLRDGRIRCFRCDHVLP